jgi:hypothetical protein
MAMAFDKRDPSVPTERWLGQVYEIEPDGGFNGYIGQDDGSDWFEHTYFVRIPLDNIIESERRRIKGSVLFFCDVELEGQSLKNIRGIEFIETEPANLEEWRQNADRFFAENPGLFDD